MGHAIVALLKMEYEQTNSSDRGSLWHESIAFYVSHAALVLKVLIPPLVIAYLGGLVIAVRIQALRSHIMSGSFPVLLSQGKWAYTRLMLPITALSLFKQWFLWTCYCFALVGICNLVGDTVKCDEKSFRGPQQLPAVANPNDMTVFSNIRERPFRFLSSATLFFGLLIVGFIAMLVLALGFNEIIERAHISIRSFWATILLTFYALALVSAVIVRWAFTVPVAILKNVSFWSALKFSDRLSDYCSLQLWLLIIESEALGYLALIAPSYILFYLHVPETALTYYGREAAALFLYAIAQAPLMIAIGLVLATDLGEVQSPANNERASEAWG